MQRRKEDHKHEQRQSKRVSRVPDREDFEIIDESLDDDQGPDFLRSKANLKRLDNASLHYSSKAVALIHRLMTAQDAHLIDVDTCMKVVNLQKKRFFGCLSLPFSLSFFVFFATSAYLHEDITNVYIIESGLRKALGQNLDKVDSIARLWKWMRFDTLVPELFDQTDDNGDPQQNKALWSRVLVYNQLQGPLVLEQSRSEKMKCKDGKGSIGKMICHNGLSESTATFGRDTAVTLAVPSHTEYSGGNVTLQQRVDYYASAFSASRLEKRRLRSMRTDYMRWLPHTETDETFSVFIYPNTPRVQIDEHFKYLYDRAWLDSQTKELVAKALLLNAEVGRPRLEQYKVTLRFSRGGGVFTRMTMESLFLEFAAGKTTIFFDVLWIACLCSITGYESKELLVSKSSMRQSVCDQLDVVVANQIADIPAEVNSMGQDFFEQTDKIIRFTSWFRLLLAYYHLILMFRFFIAFSAQPRLGAVTRTLEASLVDILHFLVVLLPTFMAYAISGCLIFGRRLEGFATFNSAMGICVKMLMESEYEWDELSREDYWTSGLWTWSFMLLVVLIMINMVLAIVLDVYSEMRKSSCQSETVLVTLFNMVQRVWFWRCWVSNNEIRRVLSAHVDSSVCNRLISREELLQLFPGMCDQQLNALIRECRFQIEVDSAADNELKEAMKMTMAIKLAVDKVNEDIAQITCLNHEETQHASRNTFKVSTDSRGWLQETSEAMAAQNHWLLSLQWQLQQLHWQWQTLHAFQRCDDLPAEESAAINEDFNW